MFYRNGHTETMITKDHISSSILRAVAHSSGIHSRCLEIGGFSTGIMRRLFNNLLNYEGTKSYLEVGLYKGGTFCSAIDAIDDLWAFGFEDFSQPFGDENVEMELAFNVSETRIGARSKIEVINQDFFQWVKNPNREYSKFDIYFYDGEHSREAQSWALPRAYPFLKDQFLFIVDDADWKDVHNGTWDAFHDLEDDVEILDMWELTDGVPDGEKWHNGLALYLCKKK